MQASIRRTIPKLRNPLLSSSLCTAEFHSTPISLAKSAKAQIRFVVRQKRADDKKALKDYFLYGKCSKLTSQYESSSRPANKSTNKNARAKTSSCGFDNIPRSKNSGKSDSDSSAYTGRGKHKPWKRKERLYDANDDIDPEKVFQATFGGQKCYTWSFTGREDLNFNNTRAGFNMGGESREEKARKRFWNESDEDEEPTDDIGCHLHRVTLGLPATGPLKLDDIKIAFRASALKWHPDKHQGPSQAMAAEKFKLCVNAYNSLRSAIRPT